MKEKEMHLNRREFIAASSVVVAGLVVAPGSALATPAATAELPVFVGYWGGAPRISRRFISGAPSTFDAAQSVLTGDPSLFSLGARIAFRGLFRRAASPARSILIDAMTVMPDGSRVPYFAFTHIEDRNGVRSSPPSSFTAVVETEGTLDLVIRSIAGAAAEATVSFAINSADKALKLNRGVYVFALTDRAPQWRSIRFASGAEAGTFVTGKPLLASAIDDQPVDFDYVVMTVGAASSPKE